MAPLLVLVGIAALLLAVVAVVPGWSVRRQWPATIRFGLAAMFTVTGVTHFAFLREDLIAMVPPTLPAPALLVTVTGVLELLGAVGLLWHRTAGWAAAGLAALLVAMFPANVYAALAGVELAGEPATPLLQRTGLQVVFLTAAVTVWAAYRRRGPVVLAVPAAHGPAYGGNAPGLVLLSRLELRSRRDIPAFLFASLRLRRSFRRTPGAMTLRLSADLRTGRFWTWSYWADERSMQGFTRSAPHRQVMADYRDRLRDSQFETLDPAAAHLPGGWVEARQMLTRGTSAVGTAQPGTQS